MASELWIQLLLSVQVGMGAAFPKHMSQSSPAEFNPDLAGFSVRSNWKHPDTTIYLLECFQILVYRAFLESGSSHTCLPCFLKAPRLVASTVLNDIPPSLALTCPGSSWPSRKNLLSFPLGCPGAPSPIPLQLFWSQESETHGNLSEGSEALPPTALHPGMPFCLFRAPPLVCFS